MSNIPIMPDIPWDYAYHFQDMKDLIVLNDRIFIKKVYITDVNVEPLLKLKDFNLEHFNTHRRLCVDEFYTYYFLISPFIKNSTPLHEALSKMNPQEVLQMFKILLTDLQKAHTQELYPFDIKFSNYLIDENGNPTFIDFDHSFYQGKYTCNGEAKTFFDLSYFNRNPKEVSDTNLMLNDKCLLLAMLIGTLLNKYFMYPNPNTLADEVIELQMKYHLTKDIVSYLEDIIINKFVPNKDDYFVDTLINPLLDISSRLEKK